MIKVYGDTYYMTMGEACYIAGGSGLEHIAFGARIEPEDDALSLGGAAARGFKEIEINDIALERGGECVTPRFAPVCAELVDKPALDALPVLRGGRTLEITLCDSDEGLELKLYYTPYIRGGMARRAVLKNLSEIPIKVKRLLLGVCTGGGERVACADGLTAVKTAAGAYGAFALYAGKTETGTSDARIACGAKIDMTLCAGESYYTPEVLFVYSDCGVGGVVRAYHDILREFGVPEKKFAKRIPVAVYCPTDSGELTREERIKAIADMGADVAVMGADAQEDVLRAYAEEIKDRGLTVGLKAAIGCPNICERAVAIGAEYVELDCGGINTYDEAVAAHAQYKKLCEALPDAYIEFCRDKKYVDAKTALKQTAYSPVPLCAVRNVVRGGALPLKTAFDVSSFGALGYEFDPAALSEGARRAVRAQILSYRDDAETIKSGDVYDIGDGIMAIGKDKSRAYAATSGAARFDGLDVHNLYHVREAGKTFSGAALAHYGLPAAGGDTVTYHIGQVADYE